jgi:hypothetical protein
MSWAPTDDEFRARIAEHNRERGATRSATTPSSTAKILNLPPLNGGPPPANDDLVLTLQDFVAYMPRHNYVCLPTLEFWPAASVNARIPPVPLVGRAGTPVLDDKGNQKMIPANAWLDANAPVEQATWAPGLPMLICDKVMSDGGWIDQPKFTVLNLYRPPTIKPARGNVDPWLNHIRRLYGEAASDHIIACLAHRVQRPEEKINHALVLGGAQGIGKDTILEPVKRAIGPWNFKEVGPTQMLGRFNGFLKSVILRMNEARDLGEFDRYSLYEHTKAYIAAPPDVLRVDEKHINEHHLLNDTFLILTTNHKTNGIYLPSDDRRHFVAWSNLTKADFNAEYWTGLYAWYDNGGNEAIAAYLHDLDLSDFNPKTPPPKTQAWWEIVDASRSPEDAELADALDQLERPDATTLTMVKNRVTSAEFAEWLGDRKNARMVPHRMEECGYIPHRNAGAADGLWKISGRRQVIYVKKELSERDASTAVRKLGDAA